MVSRLQKGGTASDASCSSTKHGNVTVGRAFYIYIYNLSWY